MERLKKIEAAAREYLAAEDEAACKSLRPALDAWDGDLEALAALLRPRPAEKAPTGWLLSQPFRSPRLAGKYPEQPITLYVPPDYDPARPYGLVIFLHGGGKGRGDGGKHTYDTQMCNDIFESCGRIVCFPSAPPNDWSWARWHLPEADAYISDVIEEIEFFYHLDPDNVVLGGTSMGGMGANHMAHRFADRLASVFASASHWDFACWPSLMGTTLWIMHGVNDATLFRRRHGTDVEFARAAKLRLEQAGVAHVYREHSGGHGLVDGRWILREWLMWSRDKRRDPFYPRVVAVTPRGLTPWSDWRRHKTPLAAHQNSTDFHDLPAAPHARWVTIEGTGPETILFDMMTMSDCRDEVENDWSEITFTIKRKHIPGALVEAVIRDDKVIEVTPRNATSFTLWLHPKMAPLDNVRIYVKGKERFHGAVKPCVSTMLDSYLRRRDWGMLYPARVTIEDDGTWATMDQLKVTPR